MNKQEDNYFNYIDQILTITILVIEKVRYNETYILYFLI